MHRTGDTTCLHHHCLPLPLPCQRCNRGGSPSWAALLASASSPLARLHLGSPRVLLAGELLDDGLQGLGPWAVISFRHLSRPWRGLLSLAPSVQRKAKKPLQGGSQNSVNPRAFFTEGQQVLSGKLFQCMPLSSLASFSRIQLSYVACGQIFSPAVMTTNLMAGAEEAFRADSWHHYALPRAG